MKTYLTYKNLYRLYMEQLQIEKVDNYDENQDLKELYQCIEDLYILQSEIYKFVHQQGEQLVFIEDMTHNTLESTQVAVHQLEEAASYQGSRIWYPLLITGAIAGTLTGGTLGVIVGWKATTTLLGLGGGVLGTYWIAEKLK